MVCHSSNEWAICRLTGNCPQERVNSTPMICAIVDEDAAVAINPEHTAFEWIDVSEAASRLMWPGDRQALEEIRTTILTDSTVKGYRRIPPESWPV